MGKHTFEYILVALGFCLMSTAALAADCGKCKPDRCNSCVTDHSCGGSESRCGQPKPCDTKCNKGCDASTVGLVDGKRFSGSLQDLLHESSDYGLIDPSCCPPERFRLLCCKSWEGFTICCVRSEFELMCKQPCEKKCKPKKNKCEQSTCTGCR